MLENLQRVLRIYTRAFVAQGVGIVGLLWCLFDNHPTVGLVLTGLVLIDQIVFLRQRFAPGEPRMRWQTGLHIWCFCISLADLLVLFAALFQTEGLRGGPGSAPVSDPLDFLAYSIASFARLDLGLSPTTGSGRLLATAEALLGYGVLLVSWALILRAALAGRPSGGRETDDRQAVPHHLSLTGPDDRG